MEHQGVPLWNTNYGLRPPDLFQMPENQVKLKSGIGLALKGA